MMSLLKRYYPLIIVSLLGAGLRLQFLLQRGQYWFDELFSIHFSGLPWPEAIKLWALETNPPLHLLLLRGLLMFVDPHHEIIVRLSSMVFGVGSIVLLYLMAERLFNRTTAVLASLFLTLSNIVIVQASEVRGYSLFMFLALASVWVFHRFVFDKKRTGATAVLLVAVNALLLYTHLAALPILCIEAVFMYFLADDKRERRRALGLQLATGLLWLPWITAFITSKFSTNISGAWYFTGIEKEQNNLLMLLLSAFTSVSESVPLALVSVLLLGLLGYFFFVILKTKPTGERHWLVFLSAVALVPPIMSAMLGVFVPKYLLPSYPMLHLVVAYTLTSLYRTRWQKIAATSGAMLLLLPPAVTITSIPVYSSAEMIRTLEAKNNASSIILVAFPNELTFNWYYRGSLPVIPIYLNDDTFSENERIVRNNWHLQITTPEKVTGWVRKQIEQYQPQTIFFIQPHNKGGYVWVEQSLETLGWRSAAKTEKTGYFGDTLVEYVPTTAPCPPVAARQ